MTANEQDNHGPVKRPEGVDADWQARIKRARTAREQGQLAHEHARRPQPQTRAGTKNVLDITD